jgi:acyl-CoA dehydrogenase
MDFSLTEEQEAFRDSVREWVERECPKPEARRLEAQEFEYPEELWAKMAAARFPGVGLPEEAGGEGGGLIEQVILQRELARSLAGLTWMWGITAFCARAVWRFGVDELRRSLVPAVADGRARIAMAVTESGGGTDLLGALRTSARREGDRWVLQGEKVWSTGALAAQHLLVLARTSEVEGRPDKGLTMFLVPVPSPGLDVRPIPKLGMRALASCVVSLDGVAVPDERVLGTVDEGWKEIASVIDTERVLLAALCCGILDGVLEDAVAYALDRHAFGRPIGQFQAVQTHLADIAMWRAQSELVTLHAAWLASTGRKFGIEADIAKVVTSEHAVAAADLGLQVLGGMGYSLETDMQRYWRDARLFRIGPVTNEVTRSMIARQLGMPRAW